MQAEGAPTQVGTAGEGAMRTECRVSHWNYDDPIVYPSNPGQAHLHMFWGNTGTNAASTYQTLRTTGGSTCAGGILNRSAYWAPALLDDQVKVRAPDGNITVYYKCSFGNAPSSCPSTQEFPPSFRMIAGYDMANSAANAENVKHYDWFCTNSAGTERGGTKAKIIPTCNVGDHLYLRFDFPQCWDGIRVDSANHRDHVAYADYRKGFLDCPPGYPVRLPTITQQIHWVVSGSNTANWTVSSDAMPGMVHEGGQTIHMDWFGAWEPVVMSTFMTNCTTRPADCVFHQIGNFQGSGNRRLRSPSGGYAGPAVFDPPSVP